MDGIHHYEGIVREIEERKSRGDRLSLDDEIDYCLAQYRIHTVKMEHGIGDREEHLRLAREYHHKAAELEKKLGIYLE